MKTILLWDPRFPDRRPARLSVEDTVASAAVRAGVAAAANPAEAGALSAGGALDPTMLTEVVLQHGNGSATRRVFLPYSVVMVGALAGVLASIGTPIAGGVTPTPSPTPTPTPTIAFANNAASVTEGDSGTKTVANVINVTRNGVTGPLTVNLSYGGTATSGTDYAAGPVSGTIADGQSTLSFDLTINGDTGVESDETIVINASLAAYSSATASKTITVTNDDVTVNPGNLPTYTFASETNSLVAAQNTAGANPNARRQFTINRMISRLKAQSFWNRIDPAKHALWVVGDTDAVSRINVLNPGTHNLVSNGTPTFTAPGTAVIPGWSFPTNADFLDTGIAANTVSTNDHAIGYFATARTGTAVSFDMGVQVTGSAALYLKQAASSTTPLVAASNGAAISPFVDTVSWDGTGLYAISRQDAASFNGFHHGINVGSVSDATTAATSATTLTVGKVNGQTSTCKTTIGAAFVMPGLSPSEMEMLHAIVQTYLDVAEFGDLDIRPAGYAPAAPAKVDLVVYGARAAGVAAAYRAAQQGLSVYIVGSDDERQIGGMTTSGLGLVDYDRSGGLGGFAWDLCADARAINSVATTHDASVGNNLAAQPKNFHGIMRRRLDGARTNGQSVPIFWSDGVASVTKDGTKITSLTTVDGRVFTADYFLDTTEELDLAFVGGCTTIIGREASQTGTFERLNGYRDTDRSTGSNDAQIENSAGARLPAAQGYVTPGDATSGLIFGILPRPAKTLGQGDGSVMSFTHRQTWNNSKARRVPWGTVAPEGYNAAKYELLGRALAYRTASGDSYSVSSFMKPSPLAGGTGYDTNNAGAISFNLLNSGNLYMAAEAAGTRAQVYAARKMVRAEVRSWVRGFIHYLVNSGDSRVPATMVTEMNTFGWDSRHYLDPRSGEPLYYPPTLYVREGRRLVGDFVFNAADVTQTDGTVPRSTKTITTVCYRFDSHPHIRFIDDASGTVFAEGGIGISQASTGGAANGADALTPVPLEAFLPKRSECTNLAATFGVSGTHIAFTAARMEMTTVQAGESLAYVVKQAKSQGNVALADVDYTAARTAILAAPATYPANLQQVN